MTPSITETELRVKLTDKWYERCLKLMARVDWRGLAIVLAAVAGIGGAIWNKLDAAIEKALAARTQQGIYEVLANKLDDVALRLTALEAAHVTKGTIAPPKPPSAPMQPIPGSETGRAPLAPTEAMVMVDVDGVPDTTFGAAKLPSFQTIQKRAETDSLPKLLGRETPMAAAAPATPIN
jgi:hypothetical protein